MGESLNPEHVPSKPGGFAPHDLLERVIDGIEDAFFALDSEWRFVYANRRAIELMTTDEEILGRSVFDVFPAQTADSSFVGVYRESMETGKAVRFESLFEPAGVWLEVNVQPYDGGLAVQLIDISSRKTSELEREALLAELAAIDRIADVALSTLDATQLLRGLVSRLLKVMDADVALVNVTGQNQVLVRDERRGVIVDPDSSIVNIVSFLDCELRYADERLGSVQVGWTKKRETHAADRRLLGLASERIASALTNARLHREVSDAARLGRTLAHINDVLHGSLAIESVVDEVLAEAVDALAVDAATVLLSTGSSGLVAQYSAGFDDIEGDRAFTYEDLPVFAAIEELSQPVITLDVLNDPMANPAVLREYGIRSSIVAPLGLRGEIIGFVGFFFRNRRGDFGESKVQFVSSLASSLSLAFDNAQIYATEHRIADALQGALIAMPERVRGMTTAHTYQAASATTGLVGGDFYDAFELEGGRAALIVGDVSGKGLGAAVFTSLIKNALRAHTVDNDPPAVAMAKTNRLTALQTDSAMFATGILAVLNVRTGELRYCNAGHPSMVVRHSDGTCEALEANSPLIGAFSDFDYDESSHPLRDGDLLVLVTDGVTEARRGMEQYGVQRMAAQIRTGPDEPHAAVAALREAVTGFTGGRLTDDIAIVALRYDKPSG